MDQLTINTDGGSRGNPGPAACAYVVVNSSGQSIFSAKYNLGTTTNNQAEYYGIIKALEWLLQSNVTNTKVLFKADSLLIINQINRLYKIKDSNLHQLVLLVNNYLSQLSQKKDMITFVHIPRHLNRTADLLVNQALDQL